MGFFTSKRDTAMEDIFNELNGIKNTGDVENVYGLKRRKAADVSSIFNPARANLATRQAQTNAAAAARMGGGNATQQGTFGSIMSQFAPAWGDLEGTAAKTGLDVERGDEGRIADMFNQVRQQKAGAAGNLSDASTFDDILSVVDTAAKFAPSLMGGSGLKKKTTGLNNFSLSQPNYGLSKSDYDYFTNPSLYNRR